MVTPKQIQDIVEYLRGSMESETAGMHAVLGALYSITPDEEDKIEKAIDEELFCCDECGWWHDKGAKSAVGRTAEAYALIATQSMMRTAIL
jgi:hypothetical protein